MNSQQLTPLRPAADEAESEFLAARLKALRGLLRGVQREVAELEKRLEAARAGQEHRR